MTPAEFRVPVADLERGPKRLDAPLSTAWLTRALDGTEATPRGPGTLSLTLSKNGDEVLVRGSVRADLQMPCVRTLDPVEVDVATEVLLLLQPAPVRPRARRAPERGAKLDVTEGKAQVKAPRRPPAEDPLLSQEDAAKDTYAGDHVELDAFVREFILLELPMTPLRSNLRSETEQARSAPLVSPGITGVEAEPPAVDPRLAPLAELASRLRQKKE